MGARQNKFPLKCICEQWGHYRGLHIEGQKAKFEREFAMSATKTSCASGFYFDYNDGNFLLCVEDDDGYHDIEVFYCPFCGKKLDWKNIKENYLKIE